MKDVLCRLICVLGLVVLAGCSTGTGGDAEALGGAIPYNNPNYAVEAGDLDNDKDIDDDILILDRQNKTLTIVLNGTTTFGTVYSLPKGSTDVVVADVAGDTWDDAVIIARDNFNGSTTVRVLVNEGLDAAGAWLGFTDGPLSSYAGSSYEFVSVGEFDAAAGPDLFVFHRRTRRYAVAPGDGAGHFSIGSGERLPKGKLILTVRELDLPAADPSDPEYPDVLILDTKTGEVTIHKNQADGTFMPPLPAV